MHHISYGSGSGSCSGSGSGSGDVGGGGGSSERAKGIGATNAKESYFTAACWQTDLLLCGDSAGTISAYEYKLS